MFVAIASEKDRSSPTSVSRAAGCVDISGYTGDVDALDPDAMYEALGEAAEDVNVPLDEDAPLILINSNHAEHPVFQVKRSGIEAAVDDGEGGQRITQAGIILLRSRGGAE